MDPSLGPRTLLPPYKNAPDWPWSSEKIHSGATIKYRKTKYYLEISQFSTFIGKHSTLTFLAP